MKIMISAGEASGDMHAARALTSLTTSEKPDASLKIEAFGMGGKRLSDAGMELLVDIEQHSVMGLVEVLHKYPKLLGHLTLLRKALKEQKPDLLLVVDYPHFNMKLAAAAKSLGIPVIYYIAPKVWASRPSRLQELKKITDHVAVILPFEVNVFNEAQIPNTYVGNPLLDNQALLGARASDDHSSQRSEGLSVALMPGSRKSEVSYLLPVMLDTAEKLSADHPQALFKIPVAETIDRDLIASECESRDLKIELLNSNDYQQIANCDLAFVASGTATLELAIMGLPMIVAYKMNPLSYAVVKRWLTIDMISLTNIIAGRKIVPEILQEDATAENLYAEAQKLLTNQDEYLKQKAELERVYQALGTGGAAGKLSKLIVRFLRTEKNRQRENAGAAAS
jgi:lipid-A-disaccharide synthase